MDNIFKVTDGKDFVGNGFIIGSELALTNSHVLRDGGTHAFLNGVHVPFYILQDFINSPEVNLNTEKLDFATIASPEFQMDKNIDVREKELVRGEPLVIRGYLKEIDQIQNFLAPYNEFSDGKFKNTASIFFKKSDLKPAKGISGSAVFDERGNIVGLFYGMRKNQEAYYIKIEYILKKLS